MKLLFILTVLLGAVGVFFSGFVFWMANSSHQRAEHLRQHGEYCDVRIIDKKTSSPGDGTSDNYYVYASRVDQNAGEPLIQCAVTSSDYNKLVVGQRLKAWVLKSDALLDNGPGNAASVAHTSLLFCIGFIVVTLAGLVGRVVCRNPNPTLDVRSIVARDKPADKVASNVSQP